MTTVTETALYSRRIRIDSEQLQPGDQIDNAIPGRDPVYDTIEKIGTHTEDASNEDRDEDDADYCYNDCAFVIFFEAEDYAYPLHVRRGNGDYVHARFPVGAAA